MDMEKKDCSCRKWELTGIPCKHAVATVWHMALTSGVIIQPEDLAHESYRLDTWKEVYSFKVEPINGRVMWPKSDCPTTLTAPPHHTQVGRPKKKRKKTIEEMSQGTKLTRGGKTVTCLKCHNKGHNSRTCKGQKSGS